MYERIRQSAPPHLHVRGRHEYGPAVAVRQAWDEMAFVERWLQAEKERAADEAAGGAPRRRR